MPEDRKLLEQEPLEQEPEEEEEPDLTPEEEARYEASSRARRRESCIAAITDAAEAVAGCADDIVDEIVEELKPQDGEPPDVDEIALYIASFARRLENLSDEILERAEVLKRLLEKDDLL